MNIQEIVEQNVRMTIGDLTLQLIMARARIAELEASISAEQPKPNGVDKGEIHQDDVRPN